MNRVLLPEGWPRPKGYANGIKARGHRSAATVNDQADLAQKLAGIVQDKDMVVCLGAGDITKWAAGLADAIKAERG